MKHIEPLTGDALEARIKELEAERDKLLAETPCYVPKDKKRTTHACIHMQYNYRISMLRKYGVEHAHQLHEVVEKSNATKLARWGKLGPCNTDKATQTKIERWGNAVGNIQKILDTRKKNWGNAGGNVQKMIATKLEKYGHVFGDKSAMDAKKRERFGEHLELLVERTQQTNLERYGRKSFPNVDQTKVAAVKIARYGKAGIGNYDKARQTNLVRYGVPWFCMTDKCKQAQGHIVSETNKWWQAFIEKRLNVSFKFECKLQSVSYDLHYGNLLIDINPSITHNAAMSIFSNKQPKQPNYHWWKQQLAIACGYTPLMIFDWHDPEIVLHVIEAHLNNVFIDCTDNALNPFVVDECTIKKHWVNTKSGEHLFDDDFNEQEMLDAGFMPVYDCGHWSYDS